MSEKLLEDIRSFFIDFEVTLKDIITLSPKFVGDFHIRALLELNVDDENVRKIQLSQSDVDQEEVEIIPELNLVTAVKTAFKFNNVGVLDFLIPDTKRTFQHISNIMEFLFFAESLVSELNPHLSDYVSTIENINLLKKQKEFYSQQSNDMALERNGLINEKKEMDVKLEELRKVIKKTTQEVEELVAKNKLVTENFNKKEMNRLSMVQEIEMKDRQIEELRSELVEHPEIDQNQLLAKESKFKKLIDKRKDCEGKAKEKKNQKLKLEAILKVMNSKLLPSCSVVAEEWKKSQGFELEIDNNEKEVRNLGSLKEGLTKKKSEWQRKLVHEENKKTMLQEEWKLSEEKLKKAILESESKYSDKFSEFKAAKKGSFEVKKQLDEANKQIEEIKRQVLESRKRFEELNRLLKKREEEEEQNISKLVEELEIRMPSIKQMKTKMSKIMDESD